MKLLSEFGQLPLAQLKTHSQLVCAAPKIGPQGLPSGLLAWPSTWLLRARGGQKETVEFTGRAAQFPRVEPVASRRTKCVLLT